MSGVTARQGQQTIQVPIWDLHLPYTRQPATNTSESCPHYLISGCGGSPRLCPRKFTQRLPRPTRSSSSQRSCQRPRRRQPRQDPGPHREYRLQALACTNNNLGQGASQQQIISQVSAALASHGQNVSVAVRAPLSGAPALQGAGLLRSVNSQAASSGAPAPATPAGAGGGGGQQQMVNLQLSVAQPQAQAGGQPQTQVQPQANSAPTTSSNQGGE